MGKEIRYLGAQIEETNSNVRSILEIVIDMKKDVDEIPGIKADIAELKADMAVVKAVLKATNKEVRDHEPRITRLETYTT